MSTRALARRTVRYLTAAAALAAVAACNDTTEPEEHDDEVAAIRLTIQQGGTTFGPYTIRPGPTVTPSPFRVPVGTSTVTATFLDADDDVVTPDAGEHTVDLQSVSPAGALTFTRTGAFAGTLVAPAAGTATLTVCLTHGGHCDVSVPNVAVTIGG